MWLLEAIHDRWPLFLPTFLLAFVLAALLGCAYTEAGCVDGEPRVREITLARVAETTSSCGGCPQVTHTEHKKMSVTFGQTIGFAIDAVIAYFGGKAVVP